MRLIVDLYFEAENMRKKKFTEEIAFRLTEAQRAAIVQLSEDEELGIGETARMLLDLGMKARGIV
jgi:hypothetical protein